MNQIAPIKASTAEIFIYGEIGAGGVTAKSVADALKQHAIASAITVRLNSPGGDVFEGNAIHNLLKSHRATVTVIIDGLAASIASVIAMAGDKIIMPKNTMMMIHDPWTIAMGSAADMRKSAGVLDKITNTLIAAYSGKSGLNDEEIKTLMADETWFNADEAVAMNFADEVADETPVVALFDLSIFRNCPAEILALHTAGTAPSTETPIVAAVPRKEEPAMNAIPQADQKFANPAFRRQVLSDALAVSIVPHLKVHEAAHQFRGAGFVEGAYQSLQMAGVKDIPVRSDRDGLYKAALHTSSDFAHILGDTGNKVLLAAYTAAAPTYKAISAERTFRDFKPTKLLRLGDFPTLLQVGETGEVQHGTIGESKEEITLATYARILSISRQMLINDDLGTFGSIAQMAGQRVAQFENALIFALLLGESGAGPTLGTDSVSLFHTASHANLASVGSAVNVISNLSAGRAAIRKQTGLDRMKLNLAPRVLLCGPDNETAADQITAKTEPTRLTAQNPFAGALAVAVDSHITDYSWFLFASPAEAPVFVHGSLPGQSAPEVVVRQGFDVMGVDLRVVRDFAAGAIDYRGAYRNSGAAPKDEPIAS